MLTPRELFDRRVRLIEESRWAELIDQYTEDAVVEMPFATPAPVRLEGRNQIAAHLSRAERLPLRFTVRDVVLHETADPRVLIAEYGYRLTNTDTGQTADVANIQTFRISGGRITHTRDFHDHRAIGRLLGHG
ncbi:nuclear transport factor 2 family protein [Catellatospora vulcania]|uniref:nuclear transport factor 2 family protein n=1 Tax=Catellatospora vulcania TaxID=1460450 RepID=UPI0012D47B44|nr:nuclear transport factor 2 family protein [Catellatospora vulcania]